MTRKILDDNFPAQELVDNKNDDTYDNYPEDLLACLEEIRTVIDGIVDAVIGARLANGLVPLDLLIPSSQSSGRFSPWEARITFTVGTTSVTVTSGRIYAAGRRIEVTGETLTGFSSAGTHYIGVDEGGGLFRETTSGLHTFDIATVTMAGATLQAGELVDNLAFEGGSALRTADVVARLIERRTPSGALSGLLDPALRAIGADGSLQDAGITHAGAVDELVWVSQRDGGAGSGNAVIAALFASQGQLLLREQARAIATGSGVASGVSGTMGALSLDTAVRREPASYFANPWITLPANSLSKPSSTRYDGTYLFAGHVVFPDTATGPVEADIIADGVVVARERRDLASSGDTILSLVGLGEMAGTASVSIRSTHAGAGALSVDCQLGLFLLGG